MTAQLYRLQYKPERKGGAMFEGGGAGLWGCTTCGPADAAR